MTKTGAIHFDLFWNLEDPVLIQTPEEENIIFLL